MKTPKVERLLSLQDFNASSEQPREQARKSFFHEQEYFTFHSGKQLVEIIFYLDHRQCSCAQRQHSGFLIFCDVLFTRRQKHFSSDMTLKSHGI